jgi:hypothetical protein
MRRTPTAAGLALAGRTRAQTSPSAPWPMRWGGLLILAYSLCACAHTPHSTPVKDSVMTTSDGGPAVNPTLTAEEVGRRFLKLLEGVKSRSDLTAEHVQAAMGLALKDSTNGPFHTQSLGDGWVYSVSLHPEKRPGDSIALELQFIEQSDRFADMSTICGLTFEDYHNALKAMGYYDHFAYDQIDGQVGRLLGVEYWKEGYSVSILPEVKRFSDGKVYPTCVRSIGLLADGSGPRAVARSAPDVRQEGTLARFGTTPATPVEQHAGTHSSTSADLHRQCAQQNPFVVGSSAWQACDGPHASRDAPLVHPPHEDRRPR